MSVTDAVSTRGHTDLHERAERVLPGGATHRARSYEPRIYVARSSGSHKWLIDGTELIDYTMGHGALLLGHAHPAVVEAVREQVARGTHYGAANPLEIEWAELITSLVPSAEKVRFTASGTEAVMLAIRVARAATGRDRVVKLAEHFHGWSDVVSPFIDETGATRTPPGVPATIGTLTTVVSSTDATALTAALAAHDVAAVILEPSGAHYGAMTLDPAYVAAARAACTATGTVLIFDEVVTGFRVAPGGMQSVLGITPDLSVLGKIMAGGLPGGAVVGRGDLLELLTGAIAHAGTYNANPLSAVAGIATLRLIADGAPQQAAEAYAINLERDWSAALITAGIPGRVWRMSSIIHVKLDDPAAQSRIGSAMRAHLIDPLNSSAFCSSVHTSEDLERSATAFAGAIVAASSGG
ncbi:MAG TPA: aminotransferase class III-fold pyridoxal phosphate-dependent enzyme [Candidatus Saccharimonadales bacterium]|nr:aminotransferase class III-fold pyridoxal phosphate-dependent enzyme [Candidatus Saccharimonadales bacterium]